MKGLLYVVLTVFGLATAFLFYSHALGPVLTYDVGPSEIMWGGDNNITIRLRNQGLQSATHYALEINISKNLTTCVVQAGSDSPIDCRDVLDSSPQPCGSDHMDILVFGDTIAVVARSFPAGCDMLIVAGTTNAFPTAKVMGDSDQGAVTTSAAAQGQIFDNRLIVSAVILTAVISSGYIIWGVLHRRKRARVPVYRSRSSLGAASTQFAKL